MFFTLYYTREAVRAARDATKDADQAIAIAQRNADAAQQQVEIAQDTARKQLRAYVSVIDPTISVRLVDDGLDLVLYIKNFGQTPAHAVSTRLRTGIRRRGSPVDWSTWASHMPYELAPGDDATLTYPINQLQGADYHARRNTLVSEGAYLVVEVRLVYGDIYGRRWRAASFFGAGGRKLAENRISADSQEPEVEDTEPYTPLIDKRWSA